LQGTREAMANMEKYIYKQSEGVGTQLIKHDTSNSVQLRKLLLPTNIITAAPSTLLFQLPIVLDQPQICTINPKPNPNVILTLILTLFNY